MKSANLVDRYWTLQYQRQRHLSRMAHGEKS